MISGVGTDIVSVSRVADLLRGEGSRFLDRWFTRDEAAYCMGQAFPERHLAARLAAKESVAKALALNPADPPPWRQIEICRDPAGKPVVRLSDSLPVAGQVLVSLSHCDEYATAVAFAVTAPPLSGRGDPGQLAVASPEGPPAGMARLVEELLATRDPGADPQLEALRIAMIVEDFTGITLSDEQIDLAHLGTLQGILRALRSPRGSD